MFRCRAQTFSERLGWEVTVRDGRERDRFDDENPLYLVSVDPRSGEYWGSLRLLPTTGPNMLRDVFPFLLNETRSSKAPRFGRVRGFVRRQGWPTGARQRRRQLRPRRTPCRDRRCCQTCGLTQIVSVFDARIFRILKAAGCKPKLIGTPRRIGGTMSYAGLFDMDEAFQRAVRCGLGIEGSVLATDAQELIAA